MKWILKAAVQKVISLLPFSEELNYFFQANITKGIPVSEKEIIEGRGTRAAEHLDIIRKNQRILSLSVDRTGYKKLQNFIEKTL